MEEKIRTRLMATESTEEHGKIRSNKEVLTFRTDPTLEEISSGI
jgi:hypothetical protein